MLTQRYAQVLGVTIDQLQALKRQGPPQKLADQAFDVYREGLAHFDRIFPNQSRRYAVRFSGAGPQFAACAAARPRRMSGLELRMKLKALQRDPQFAQAVTDRDRARARSARIPERLPLSCLPSF
jgi:hypothetical protein